MTFQMGKFIRKIKRTQVCEDWTVWIDFDTMTAVTYNRASDDTVTTDLSDFKASIHSMLSELQSLGYIELGDFGYCSLTHSGWHAREITVQSAIKFTVRDIIVPLAVSAAANFLPELIQLIQESFQP